MYVQPLPGLKIRDPDLHDFLPDAGRDVPETDYWHRRLRDKDVVEVQAPAEPPTDGIAQLAHATAPTGE